MKRLNPYGFSGFEAVVVVVVIAIVGLAGWNIYQRSQKSGDVATTKTTTTKVTISSAPDISSTGDLTKAADTLDQTSLDNTDELNQLDSDLAAF